MICCFCDNDMGYVDYSRYVCSRCGLRHEYEEGVSPDIKQLIEMVAERTRNWETADLDGRGLL